MRIRALYALAAALIYLAPFGASAANQTAVTTPSGSTHGGLVSGHLATATGTNTVTDSGLATANVPTLSGVNTFSALQTWSTTQWSGVVNANTGQPLNLGLGQEQDFGTPEAASVAEFSKGTTASPITEPTGPLVALYRTSQGDGTGADCGGNSVKYPCHAVLYAFHDQLASDNDQEVGIGAGCLMQTTVNGNLNCIAGHFEARTGGTFPNGGIAHAVAVGAISVLTSYNSGATANPGNAEAENITLDNESGHACSYSFGNQGQCNGLDLISNGASPTGIGVHLRGGPGNWDYGILCEQGAINIACFDDESSAPVSLNIDGTHATAAINVAASAGSLVLNGNNIVGAGTVQATMAPPGGVASGIVYGGTTAASSNCGSLSGAAGCVVIKVGIATHYLPYY